MHSQMDGCGSQSDQARVNGGSNYDSLKVAKCLGRPAVGHRTWGFESNRRRSAAVSARCRIPSAVLVIGHVSLPVGTATGMIVGLLAWASDHCTSLKCTVGSSVR